MLPIGLFVLFCTCLKVMLLPSVANATTVDGATKAPATEAPISPSILACVLA
jgi:hypothetical protein